MRKSAKNSVSSLVLAAILTSGFVGIDAASAKQNKSDVMKSNPDLAVAKKNKSGWIFPTLAALAAAVSVLAIANDDKPTSP
jgi:hypothetical protein